MNNSVDNKTERFGIDFLKNDKSVWRWQTEKKSLLLWGIGTFLALGILYFIIFAVTPIKRLMPGFTSEKERQQLLYNSFKLDSLSNEVNLWKQELRNIQLITSGMEPIVIKSDSAYIETIDASNALQWKKSEEKLRAEVEENNSK